MKKILKYFFLSIFLMLFLTAAFLFIMARFHHDRMHSRILELVNSQFNEQVTIGDFSLSYLRDFPHMHIGIEEIDFRDKGKSVLKADKVDLAVNLRDLRNKKINIEKAEITGLVFNSVTDSAGNKPHLLDKSRENKDSSGSKMSLEIEEVIIKDSRVHTGNEIKGGKNYLSIYRMQLRPLISTDFTDISFTLSGNLDSLFSNRKLLIRNQPLSVPSATLRLHKTSKIVELIEGEVFSNGLKLVPQLKLSPEGKSKLINLKIDAAGSFNNILSLVELQLGEKFRQVSEDAKITGSLKLYGITDAFTKPNSEINFLVENAELEGELLPYNIEIQRMVGYYNNGSGRSRETTIIQIDTLLAQVGSSTIKGNFHMENLTNPLIRTVLDSDISIADFVNKSPGLEASGDILLNVKYEGLVSELKKMHYSGYLGSLDFKNIIIGLAKQDKIISIPGASMVLNNHVLDFGKIKGTVNNESFRIEGVVQNPLLHLVNRNEDLSAKISLAFDKVELGLRQDSARQHKPGNLWAALWSLFADHVAVDMRLTGKKLVANNFELKNIVLSASQNDNLITINSFGFRHERDVVSGKGSLIFSKYGITSLSADLTGRFENLDSILKVSSGKKSGGTNFPVLPKNTRISVSLSAVNGTLGPFSASNMKLKASLDNEKLLLNELSLTIPEGRIALKGKVSLDSAGFSGADLDVLTDFDKLDVDDWIIKLKNQNSKENHNKKLAIPKWLSIGVGIRVKDLLYKDLHIRDVDASATLKDEVISLGSLNAKLPFGTATIRASISEFSSELPKISGTVGLRLDSVSVDSILAMQAFHSKSGNNDNKKTKGSIPLFRKNLNLSLNMSADKITYKGAVAEKVQIDFNADETKAELGNLNFIFASGSFKLKGYMLNSMTGYYPSYLSTSISKLRIEEIISMFDGFNQDVITPENTQGEFSWNSDHHFALTPDLNLNLNDNIWFFDFNIHDAKLTDVAPIQNALFFIGHKAKSNMVIKDLSLHAYMHNDKLLFSEVLMNDNIANFEIFGSYSLSDSLLDFGSKISLTDLFFRSKNERMLETSQGIVPLEQDSKVYIRLQGSPADHKIQLNSRKKITRFEKDLIGEIEKANKDFLKKEKKRKATNPF